MAKDLFSRYVWLVDTIRRYGRISRRELDECWARSGFSTGGGIPRRTFYNYRQAAEELFGIEIKCDPKTFEYYIEGAGNADGGSVTDWVLNSAAVNDLLTSSSDVASRIFVEEVPSAREFLAPIIEALRRNRQIEFDYLPYSRSLPTRDVRLEPYFLKIFKQRWYITGHNVGEARIKTYALDRMTSLRVLPDTFTPDQTFDPREYFRYSFGIVFTANEPKHIVLRATPRQAKYLRALPLHHSQVEYNHDDYSLFHYDMRISPDLVEEILSHGARLIVVEPPELRAMVAAELREALDMY